MKNNHYGDSTTQKPPQPELSGNKHGTYTFRLISRFFDLNRYYTFWIRHRFKRLDSLLNRHVTIRNPEFISIGTGVRLDPYTWIYAIHHNFPQLKAFHPTIEICDYTTIGRFCHLTISNQLLIESHVLITQGVLITDTSHEYEDIATPIIKQPLLSLGPIIIGQGSWIRNGARIVGKVKVGRHCVIGADTYIDKDIPDYSVVAGSPARIIRQYDFDLNLWVKKEVLLKEIQPAHLDIRPVNRCIQTLLNH